MGNDCRTPEIASSLLGDWYLDDFHTHRIDRHQFIIYVGSDPQYSYYKDNEQEVGVEPLMADRLEISLSILSGISNTRPILIYIATCGGLWEEGMQMCSALLHCTNPVTVFVTKWARSMSSIIPLAADKFIIRPPAQYMFHRGTVSFSGTDQEFERYDIERRKAIEQMFRIYTARLKQQGCYRDWTPKQIRTMLDQRVRREIDVWYTAEQALEAGFVDEIHASSMDIVRAQEKNLPRRRQLRNVLRRPVNVEIRIS